MEKLEKNIKNSWYRCCQNNIAKDLKYPRNYISKDKIKNLKEENIRLISIYKNEVAFILNEYNFENSVFILTNPQGIVLSLFCSDKLKMNLKKYKITEGVLFTEKSCGTNAISLAMDAKDIVYLEGQEHYCNFLQNWSCISSPVKLNDEIIGYLDISFLNKELDEKKFMLFELLLKKISDQFKNKFIQNLKKDIRMCDVCDKVLEFSANGHTIKEISSELSLSTSSIKKYRKKIYRELDAENVTNAVAKAIKYGFLDVNDIKG